MIDDARNHEREDCFLCVVRAEFTLVDQRPLNAKARIQSQRSPCVICDEKNDTETGVSKSTSFFPCLSHSNNAPHSSSTFCLWQMEKRVKLVTFRKSCALSGKGEH
jgi:hypothetical protein